MCGLVWTSWTLTFFWRVCLFVLFLLVSIFLKIFIPFSLSCIGFCRKKELFPSWCSFSFLRFTDIYFGIEQSFSLSSRFNAGGSKCQTGACANASATISYSKSMILMPENDSSALAAHLLTKGSSAWEKEEQAFCPAGGRELKDHAHIPVHGAWLCAVPTNPNPQLQAGTLCTTQSPTFPQTLFTQVYLLVKYTMLCIWRDSGLWLTLLKDTARERASHRAGANTYRCCSSRWRPSHE